MLGSGVTGTYPFNISRMESFVSHWFEENCARDAVSMRSTDWRKTMVRPVCLANIGVSFSIKAAHCRGSTQYLEPPRHDFKHDVADVGPADGSSDAIHRCTGFDSSY